MPKESTIVAAVLKYLRARGYWAAKLHGGPYQMAGLPDVLAIKGGLATWVEVKRPGEKPTAIQESMMRTLANAGSIVIVATSIEDLEAKGVK